LLPYFCPIPTVTGRSDRGDRGDQGGAWTSPSSK
jgi:hypothetical protein